MLPFQTWWTSYLSTLFNVSKVVHHNHHDTVSIKVFKANSGSCKSHKLNTLRQRIATSSTKLFSTPGPPERLLGPGLAAWASEDGHWLAWAQFNNSLVSSGDEICVYFRRYKFLG